MSLFHRSAAALLAVAAIIVACSSERQTVGPRENGATTSGSIAAPTDAHFTMGSGSTSTPLGRATFSDPDNQTVNIKRKTGDWDVQIKAKPAFDIAVQSIVFQPGGQSGWHSHPGPVFIQVVSGTMTFYESTDPTCTPIVRTAGQGYLDLGEDAHIARNESSSPATNVVTYFAPPGAALKIDAPRPGNCPF
ncbi:MAG: hypothetical protein ACJ8AF_11455 [Gemmatimonadaceae bacterium]|jgi:hypothetical protein